MKQSIYFSACACLILMLYAIGWSQKPELIVQTSHSTAVMSVAFSPNGKLLASGGGDSMIKLWDMETGKSLRTLPGHIGWVVSVMFSPDGKQLASSSLDNTVKLWDVNTGGELGDLSGHSKFVKSVAFSPDGRLIASGSYDQTIKLWDAGTRRELRTLAGHSNGVEVVAFSPDGQLLASGSGDMTVKLWNVETGRELGTLTGHSNGVTAIAFSPDGQLLASGSLDTTVKLWNVETGREVRSLAGHSNLIWSIAFAPDGKLLASGSRDSTIKLWDPKTGKDLRTLAGDPDDAVFGVAFSPDGKRLAAAKLIPTIHLWDVATGKELRALIGHSSPHFSTTLSADGKLIASWGEDNKIHLWNMEAGKEFVILSGHSNLVRSVAFSPDGKLLASGGFDKTIKLWDVQAGKELRTMKGHAAEVYVVVFSPDGKLIASGSGDTTIKLWNVETGRELEPLTTNFSEDVRSVVFSPNWKQIAAIGRSDSTIYLWDSKRGRKPVALTGHSREVRAIAFSPDGKLLASGGVDKTIKLWNVETGRDFRTFKHSGYVFSVAFSPDGKQLAAGSADSIIKLWEVGTGKELKTLAGHSASVYSVEFSLNKKWIISSSLDTIIKIWDAATGKQLANMIAIDNNDWLVTTPDGFFDGTSAAWKQIFWRFNNNTLDYGAVELYFTDFFYPNLLQDVLADKSPRPQAGQELEKIDRRQPKVEITSVNAQTKSRSDSHLVSQFLTDKRMTRVIIEVADNVNRKKQPDHQQTSGAQDLRLFRNGYLMKVWRGDVFNLSGKDNCQQIAPSKVNEPRRVRCQAEVSVTTGDNSFTAYAFNASNIKSNDDAVMVKGADSLKRTGTLYVLAIGIGQYENPRYNLNYTVADAQSFGEEIKRHQEQVRQYARVDVFTLLNEQAKKAKIMAVLKKLADTMQPEDGMIVYFSGHGTAEGNRFYLIPHDLGYQGRRDNLNALSLRTILAHSISDRELEEAFEKIDAGQLLLVIDACNSGQALDAEEKRRGPMNSKGLAQLAYEKGMYVLTASQSIELAFESEILKHSYMTYALVEEGLKSRIRETDANSDGQVWLREWFDYTVQRVPRMREEEIEQKEKQKNKSLEIVEIAEQGKVQTPRVFYRREADTQPWIVGRVR